MGVLKTAGMPVGLIALVTLGLLLAGTVAGETGTGGPQDQPAPPVEAEEPSGWKPVTPEQLALEQRLKERVQARWNAVIERDFTEAYRYETPAYREAQTARDYASEFGGMVDWHVATVRDVRYDAPHEAVVKLILGVSFFLGGEEMRTDVPLDDRWVYLEDEWWRVHSDRPLVNPTDI